MARSWQQCQHGAIVQKSALQDGDPIRIFSRHANKWVDGKVVRILERDRVRVEYDIGEYHCGKSLQQQSNHIDIPCSNDLLSDESDMASPFQGCRTNLPAECKGDPANYYINMDYVWTLLQNELTVLVKGTWLLERIHLSSELPSFQDLPACAKVDTHKLRHVVESWREINISYKPIVSISHCWISQDHPDPNGTLLRQLRPVIESRMKLWKSYEEGLEMLGSIRNAPNLLDSLGLGQYKECFAHQASPVHDFDEEHKEIASGGAFFFDWCSLPQLYHQVDMDGKYRRSHCLEAVPLKLQQAQSQALENMDIWYTHEQTEVWMLTNFVDGQGLPYNDRGWPTWERTVAGLLGGPLLDLGLLDLDALENLSSRGFSLWDTQYDNIVEQCRGIRRPPLSAERFKEVIEQKHFTCGMRDCKMVANNYLRNFDHAVKCMRVARYGNVVMDEGHKRQELQKLITDLKEKGPSQEHVHSLCKLIPALKNDLSNINQHLAHMQQHWGRGWDSNDFCQLFDVLKSCVNLREVNLEKNGLQDDIFAPFCDTLMHLPMLESLELAGNRIADDGICALAGSLPNCMQIRSIDLSCNCFGDDGFLRLAKSFENLLLLERLELCHNSIADAGACALGEALQICIQVKVLKLHNNKIADFGAQGLAQGLHKQLEHLELGENNIGDLGAVALGETLPVCVGMMTFTIGNNRVGDVGAQAIWKGLQGLPKLDHLHMELHGNAISENVKNEITKQIPTAWMEEDLLES